MQAQAFLDDAAALRQMAEMCSEAFENARENEREFGGKESEERYSKDSVEVVSIKQQLRDARELLNQMDIVAHVSSDLTFKQYKTEAKNRLKAIMEKGIIIRKDFGKIVFSDKTTDNAMKYADTEAEKAAILAAPMVIKFGKKIFSNKNHKGRGVATTTFAAPITIDKKRGNMAVVIKQTDKNRYSAHRILLPDGTMFVLDKEKDAENANVGSIAEDNSNPRPTIISASIGIISQASEKSNLSQQNNSDGGEEFNDPNGRK